MQTEYSQRLALKGHSVIITYNFRERWQRSMNGHMKPPVVVKMHPNRITERKVLENVFTRIEDDIIFVVREYLSTIRHRFYGVSFEYALVNHAISFDDNGAIAYYRAELKWYYND